MTSSCLSIRPYFVRDLCSLWLASNGVRMFRAQARFSSNCPTGPISRETPSQRSHRDMSSTLQQNALHVDIVAQDTCYDRTFLAESPRSSRKAQVRDLRRGPHRRERFNDIIPRQMAGERRDTHPRPCRPARALAAAAARDTCACAGFARCMYSRPPRHRLVSAHGRARASRAATRNHAAACAAER